MYPKSPANRRRRMHHVNILPGRSLFCCTDPSNHARRANLAIPGCFVWELRARRGARRGEGYRRSACGSRTPPPLCARRRGAFAGSSHAALSCPRSRARCSCCCACSRVRRARCPPLLREARTFRGAPFAHLLEPRCAQSARLSSLGYHERPRKQPGACRDRSGSGSRCRSWRRDPGTWCRTLRRFRKGCRRSAPRIPARFRSAR